MVGVTSNPTIFQGAIAEGDAYDDQIRELSGELDDPTEIFWQLAKDDIRDACDILRAVWDEGKGKDGWVSLEVDPTLAHDTEATAAAAERLHGLVDRPNAYIKIPATKEGVPGDRGHDRQGHPGQRHADLLARAPPRGRRGLHPRRAALRRRRRRPERQARLGRVVLRLARGHRGRPAARRDRRPRRASRASSGSPTRKLAYQVYLEVFSGPAVGGAGGQGRDQAALPVGFDVDQEQGLQGHALRRGTGRAGHGQHDAAVADRAPSSTTARSAATRSSKASTRPSSCWPTSRPPASPTTT